METHTQTVSPRGERLSRESLIGLLALTVTVVVMAVEQLADSSPGLADPIGFMVNTGVLVVAAYLFVVAVPRIKSHPGCRGVAAPLALVVSLVAVPTMFVALPFGLSAAAVALGLLGRHGDGRRLADTAIVIGALVTLLALGYLATV